LRLLTVAPDAHTGGQLSGIAPVRATNVRWRIMALIAIVNMMTSFGKISMGVTAKYFQEDFSLTTANMGWILGAFAVGYALFQVPGGWAGDKFGPRKVLTLAILAYSFSFTLMAIVPQLPTTRWVGIVPSFAIVRFLIGAGEAFTPPNSARVVGSWMAARTRGLGISFTTIGVGAGGAITPLLMAFTAEHWGWQASFLTSGLLGFLVAFGWGFYARNRPEEHPGINAAELKLLRSSEETATHRPTVKASHLPTPWASILSRRSTWALLLSYSFRAYTMFFFDTWFFTYLIKVRGLTVLRGSLWASTPYLAVLLFSPLGGIVSDLAVNKFGRTRGRQMAVWLGMACSGALVLVGCHTQNETLAILLVSSAAGFNMFANVTWWATCIDVAPNFAASLSGLMNMIGGLSGFLAPIAIANLVTRFGWTWALNSVAFLCLASGLLWFWVRAGENLESAPA
jgi:ACS family glucarate transporter-like MFS transporter